MENQHRKISGYRELSQHEIDLMNEVKARGAELDSALSKIASHVASQWSKARTADAHDELARLAAAEPNQWLSLGRIQVQQGLMAAVRAIAQPTTHC